MATISVKCPSCNAIVKVKEEKEFAFCTNCGEKIQVQEALENTASATISEGTIPTQPLEMPVENQAHALRESTASRRKEREEAALARKKAEELSCATHNMIVACKSEEDYMMLRSKVSDLDIPAEDKAEMICQIEETIKKRLKPILINAEKYARIQSGKPTTMPIRNQCILLLIVGSLINMIFDATAPGVICVIAAVVLYLKNKNDKPDSAKEEEYKQAAEAIARYRELGYKI